MYASVDQVSIGSDNGLLPIRRHAIIWTSAGLLPIRPLGTIGEILPKCYKLFIHENAYENIVCEKTAILSRWRWVKQTSDKTVSGVYFYTYLRCESFFMTDHLNTQMK